MLGGIGAKTKRQPPLLHPLLSLSHVSHGRGHYRRMCGQRQISTPWKHTYSKSHSTTRGGGYGRDWEWFIACHVTHPSHFFLTAYRSGLLVLDGSYCLSSPRGDRNSGKSAETAQRAQPVKQLLLPFRANTTVCLHLNCFFFNQFQCVTVAFAVS